MYVTNGLACHRPDSIPDRILALSVPELKNLYATLSTRAKNFRSSLLATEEERARVDWALHSITGTRPSVIEEKNRIKGECSLVVQLKESGLTSKEIARETDLSLGQIASRIRKHKKAVHQNVTVSPQAQHPAEIQGRQS